MDMYYATFISILIMASTVHTRMDILFLVDSSASVGDANFHKMLDFVKGTVQSMSAPFKKSQIGLSIFSNITDKVLDFSGCKDTRCFDQTLSTVGYTPGDMNTSEVFKDVAQYWNNTQDAAARKYVVTLLDGVHGNLQSAADVINMTRPLNITYFNIGIGPAANEHAIHNLTSKPYERHALRADSFDLLRELRGPLLDLLKRKDSGNTSVAALPIFPNKTGPITCKDDPTGVALCRALGCAVSQLVTDTLRHTMCQKYCGFCDPEENGMEGVGSKCYYDGEFYNQGDTWTDGCALTCTCDNAYRGHYSCQNRCPSYYNLHPECRLVWKPGECCLQPDCAFNRKIGESFYVVNSTKFLNVDLCAYGNGKYFQWQKWQVGCNLTCQCVNMTMGIIRCQPRCPTYGSLPTNCKLVRKPGACCEEAVCTFETQHAKFMGYGSTNGNGMQKALVPKCIHQGTDRKQGQKWKFGIWTCVCEDATMGYYRCLNTCPSFDRAPTGCSMVQTPSNRRKNDTCYSDLVKCPRRQVNYFKDSTASKKVPHSTPRLVKDEKKPRHHGFAGCQVNNTFYAPDEDWDVGCQRACKCVNSSGFYYCTNRCPFFSKMSSGCTLSEYPADTCCLFPVCKAFQGGGGVTFLVFPEFDQDGDMFRDNKFLGKIDLTIGFGNESDESTTSGTTEMTTEQITTSLFPTTTSVTTTETTLTTYLLTTEINPTTATETATTEITPTTRSRSTTHISVTTKPSRTTTHRLTTTTKTIPTTTRRLTTTTKPTHTTPRRITRKTKSTTINPTITRKTKTTPSTTRATTTASRITHNKATSKSTATSPRTKSTTRHVSKASKSTTRKSRQHSTTLRPRTMRTTKKKTTSAATPFKRPTTTTKLATTSKSSTKLHIQTTKRHITHGMRPLRRTTTPRKQAVTRRTNNIKPLPTIKQVTTGQSSWQVTQDTVNREAQIYFTPIPAWLKMVEIGVIGVIVVIMIGGICCCCKKFFVFGIRRRDDDDEDESKRRRRYNRHSYNISHHSAHSKTVPRSNRVYKNNLY